MFNKLTMITLNYVFISLGCLEISAQAKTEKYLLLLPCRYIAGHDYACCTRVPQLHLHPAICVRSKQ